MQEDIPWKLLEGFFKKELSTDESEKFHVWLLSNSENRLIFNQLKAYFIEHGSLPTNFKPNAAIALEVIHSKLPAKKKRKTISLSLLIKIAAVTLIFAVAYWFISGKLSIKANELVIISTQQNVIKNYPLPDGSFVWLNNTSTLKYDKDFKKSRTIYLTGEAYFEVAHDKSHPFRVFAGKSVTTVVGTKFNLDTRSENKVKLSVLEGKVLFGSENKATMAFTKGQQGVFDNETTEVAMIENIDRNYLSWKTHNFYFDNEKLSLVLKRLADVYSFQYNIEDQALRDYALTARFNQRSLPEIMQAISMVTNARITRSENVYVFKSK